MRQLAELITKPEDGRLARTMVNRLWAWFFGRGLVEPVDDLDQPAWHTDLLDFLAADFADHGYDLKRMMKLICTSRAYQLTAMPAPRPDQAGNLSFGGPLVRRMTAEQFADAASSLTGAWAKEAALVPPHRKQGERFRAALVNDDPLTRALGRPNREQVLTRRDTLATTLQGIELTNGATLDQLIRQGAANWLAETSGGSEELIERIYQSALGRKPDLGETGAAREMVGSPAAVDGVADLLWALLMLPEFQLIY
jgi:hypothetical protein